MLDTFTPKTLDRDSAELELSSLNAVVAVAEDVVLIVNVIILGARPRATREPVKRRRAPVSLSWIASSGTPNSRASARRNAVSLNEPSSSIVTEHWTRKMF